MLFILFLLFLSLGMNIFLGIGVYRALRKTESSEAFFNAIQIRLKNTIDAMRSIDIRGAFESDDEVGGVFKQMKAMVEALDVYLIEETQIDATTK